MKQVTVRFEEERERRDIDVLFTASEEDEQVTSLMRRVGDPLASTLVVSDSSGASVTLPEERIVSISADAKKRMTASIG